MATRVLTPLTTNEIAETRYTHRDDIYYRDLTQATTNTEQVFTYFVPVEGDLIRNVGVVLAEAFQNTADAAYNTTTIRVGGTADDDEFILAVELNLNGTEVYHAYNTGDALPKAYSATNTDAILITFGAQSGKSLNSLNKGHVIVMFDILKPSEAGFELPAFGKEIVGA